MEPKVPGPCENGPPSEPHESNQCPHILRVSGDCDVTQVHNSIIQEDIFQTGQCFPELNVRGILLASKNNHRTSHLCSPSTECPDDGYTKLDTNISEPIFDIYKYIPAAHVTVHCMVWPSLN
jgi:hypothetical protein